MAQTRTVRELSRERGSYEPQEQQRYRLYNGKLPCFSSKHLPAKLRLSSLPLWQGLTLIASKANIIKRSKLRLDLLPLQPEIINHVGEPDVGGGEPSRTEHEVCKLLQKACLPGTKHPYLSGKV